MSLDFKKNNICPRCEVKKALAKTKIHYTKDEMYNNGAALTPPMGWSSWNIFRHKIDENVILQIAKAVKEYIHYYNNERIQKKTKWMPPVKYREASICA